MPNIFELAVSAPEIMMAQPALFPTLALLNSSVGILIRCAKGEEKFDTGLPFFTRVKNVGEVVAKGAWREMVPMVVAFGALADGLYYRINLDDLGQKIAGYGEVLFGGAVAVKSLIPDVIEGRVKAVVVGTGRFILGTAGAMVDGARKT